MIGRWAGHENRCLDVDRRGTQNGTNIHSWECNGTIAQMWVLIRR